VLLVAILGIIWELLKAIMNRNTLILFLLSFSILSCGLPNDAYAQVKKSTSGICHDSSSASYNRTKNFEVFNTIEACLESGGRLPKSKSSYQQAEKELLSEGKFLPLYTIEPIGRIGLMVTATAKIHAMKC